jgi:trimeric autotransporter adhesin
MTSIATTSSRTLRVLILGASTLALSAPALANQVIFPTSGTEVVTGQRTTQGSGVTQIKLKSGAIISISEGAEYTLNEDGSVDLHKGSITVTGAPRARVDIRMPGGVVGQIVGTNSSASFSVAEDGSSSGHTLTGVVRVSTDGKRRKPYREGQMWSAEPGESPELTFANAAIEQPGATPTPTPVPEEVVAYGGNAGPVNAALNGIPVTLGDGLAAAGASSDIIAAGRRVEAAVANPSIDRFPSGDLALLVALAAELEGAFGGTPFEAAQADIIRTYLGFLASGASGADFLTAYSNFTLGYLELIRAGGVPSGFSSGVAGAVDIDAYLAFIARTGAISALSAQDRALADAYIAFLARGQNRDLFASSFTELTAAYFAFLRSGGVPSEFTGASQAALAETIAFLQQSGLLVQLSATDQALVTAFLANGGIGFTGEFRTALQQYFVFLASGQRPSDYTELDQATLRAYLETLSSTGLLTTLLGEQALFYADYLAFLRAGGDVDGFAGLPANIFAGYQADLAAYFEFLENGGIPSAYTPLSQEVIAQYIAALEEAGATQAFLGDLASFYQAYFAFFSEGGNPDNFGGLPVPPDFPAFAAALNAYATFLAGNGLPSDFTENDLAQLQELFNALQQAGRVDELLGNNAALLSAYFAFINGGGGVDAFAGLPIYLDYIAALNAYFEFLAAGNLPSAYTVLDQATIEAYLAALAALQGGLAGFSDLNQFFVNYYNFLLAGNDPDLFDGLPGQTGGGNSGTFADFVPGEKVTAFSVGAQRSGRTRINNPAVAQNGALSGDFFAPGTARITDVGGDERGIVGAYRDGTFSFDNGETFRDLGPNQALHYVGLQPIIGDLPTTGTIDYDVIAATAPTYSDGSTGSGVFDANLTVGFGSSLTYGIDGTITMPDATYTFASPGRDNGDLVAPQVPNADFFVIRPDLTGPGLACEAGQSCQLNMFGAFSGSSPEERVGFAYETINRTIFDAPKLTGAVLFGAEGSFSSGDSAANDRGGGMGSSTGSDFTGTRTGQVYYTFLNGSLAFAFGGTADFVDGEVTGLANALGTVSSNDATIVEATDLEEIAWARWTNGTVLTRGLLGESDSLIGPNGGYHVMTGEVTTSLPVGTVAYELIGGTSATDSLGSSPGSVTGDLAIAFGTTSRVGYDLTMAVGGRSWSVSTNGGAADPGSSQFVLETGSAGFTFGGSFTSTSGTVTSTGDTCTPGCFVNVSGTLYGDSAAYAALAMNVTDNNSTGVVGASGLAIFGQEGSGASATKRVASTDWSRWTGPQTSTTALIDLGPETLAAGSVRPRAPVEPASRAEAVARAQAMTGGMISWSGAARQ